MSGPRGRLMVGRRVPLAVALVGAALLAACSGGKGGKGGADATAAATTTPGTTAAADAAPARVYGEPLLWRVDGKGGPVWLYGTIHVGGKEDVHPLAWEKLKTAKRFVMEADISKVDQMQVMQMAMLPPGESLDKKMKPAEWEKVVAIAGKKLPEETLKRFQPWFISILLITSEIPTTVPTDLALLNEAKAQGKPLDYLESWDYQVKLLRDISSVEDLVTLVENYDEFKKSIKDLLEAYAKGDAEALAKLMSDPRWAKADQQERLLYKRNEEWIPHLERFAAEGNVFVAVGAGHLVGPRSVPELLEKKGLKVTRLTAAGQP